MMRPISIDSPSNRRIVAALEQHGPMTPPALAEAAHISLRTLDSTKWYLPALLEAGRVHILRWIRADELGRTGRPRPVYAAGPGTNAPRPKPLPDAERCRRYRTTTKYAAYVTRKLVRRKGGLAGVDPVLAALLGVQSTADEADHA